MANPSFPWLPGGAPVYLSSFKHNIVAFLKEFGSLVPLKLQLTTAWIVQLKHKNGVVKLHVYEEHLDESSGTPSICDQCRNMGWQHHPVSNRRYHFILPSPAVLSDPDQLPSLVEAAAAGRVGCAKAVVSSLSVEMKDAADSAYNAPASIFDSTTHCLHGVVHGNGFGHLLRVNGRDGAAATAAAMAAAAADEGLDSAATAASVAAAASVSTSLSGPELMHLWDQLCSTLRAREVSVEDVSNKASMLLRLLYSAAHTHTWYGKWGYDFGRAAFNYGAEDYAAAVRVIHGAPVSALLQDMEGVDAIAYKILRTYCTLPPSLPPDATLGQLLQRMLYFISRPDVLKDVRVQHIAATKAAFSAKAAHAAYPGTSQAQELQLQLSAVEGDGGVAVGGCAGTAVTACTRKPPRLSGKVALQSALQPPAKRGRRSLGSEEPTAMDASAGGADGNGCNNGNASSMAPAALETSAEVAAATKAEAASLLPNAPSGGVTLAVALPRLPSPAAGAAGPAATLALFGPGEMPLPPASNFTATPALQPAPGAQACDSGPASSAAMSGPGQPVAQSGAVSGAGQGLIPPLGVNLPTLSAANSITPAALLPTSGLAPGQFPLRPNLLMASNSAVATWSSMVASAVAAVAAATGGQRPGSLGPTGQLQGPQSTALSTAAIAAAAAAAAMAAMAVQSAGNRPFLRAGLQLPLLQSPLFRPGLLLPQSTQRPQLGAPPGGFLPLTPPAALTQLPAGRPLLDVQQHLQSQSQPLPLQQQPQQKQQLQGGQSQPQLGSHSAAGLLYSFMHPTLQLPPSQQQSQSQQQSSTLAGSHPLPVLSLPGTCSVESLSTAEAPAVPQLPAPLRLGNLPIAGLSADLTPQPHSTSSGSQPTVTQASGATPAISLFPAGFVPLQPPSAWPGPSMGLHSQLHPGGLQDCTALPAGFVPVVGSASGIAGTATPVATSSAAPDAPPPGTSAAQSQPHWQSQSLLSHLSAMSLPPLPSLKTSTAHCPSAQAQQQQPLCAVQPSTLTWQSQQAGGHSSAPQHSTSIPTDALAALQHLAQLARDNPSQRQQQVKAQQQQKCQPAEEPIAEQPMWRGAYELLHPSPAPQEQQQVCQTGVAPVLPLLPPPQPLQRQELQMGIASQQQMALAQHLQQQQWLQPWQGAATPWQQQAPGLATVPQSPNQSLQLPLPQQLQQPLGSSATLSQHMLNSSGWLRQLPQPPSLPQLPLPSLPTPKALQTLSPQTQPLQQPPPQQLNLQQLQLQLQQLLLQTQALLAARARQVASGVLSSLPVNPSTTAGQEAGGTAGAVTQGMATAPGMPSPQPQQQLAFPFLAGLQQQLAAGPVGSLSVCSTTGMSQSMNHASSTPLPPASRPVVAGTGFPPAPLHHSFAGPISPQVTTAAPAAPQDYSAGGALPPTLPEVSAAVQSGVSDPKYPLPVAAVASQLHGTAFGTELPLPLTTTSEEGSTGAGTATKPAIEVPRASLTNMPSCMGQSTPMVFTGPQSYVQLAVGPLSNPTPSPHAGSGPQSGDTTSTSVLTDAAEAAGPVSTAQVEGTLASSSSALEGGAFPKGVSGSGLHASGPLQPWLPAWPLLPTPPPQQQYQAPPYPWFPDFVPFPQAATGMSGFTGILTESTLPPGSFPGLAALPAPVQPLLQLSQQQAQRDCQVGGGDAKTSASNAAAEAVSAAGDGSDNAATVVDASAASVVAPGLQPSAAALPGDSSESIAAADSNLGAGSASLGDGWLPLDHAPAAAIATTQAQAQVDSGQAGLSARLIFQDAPDGTAAAAGAGVASAAAGSCRTMAPLAASPGLVHVAVELPTRLSDGSLWDSVVVPTERTEEQGTKAQGAHTVGGGEAGAGQGTGSDVAIAPVAFDDSGERCSKRQRPNEPDKHQEQHQRHQSQQQIVGGPGSHFACSPPALVGPCPIPASESAGALPDVHQQLRAATCRMQEGVSGVQPGFSCAAAGLSLAPEPAADSPRALSTGLMLSLPFTRSHVPVELASLPLTSSLTEMEALHATYAGPVAETMTIGVRSGAEARPSTEAADLLISAGAPVTPHLPSAELPAPDLPQREQRRLEHLLLPPQCAALEQLPQSQQQQEQEKEEQQRQHPMSAGNEEKGDATPMGLNIYAGAHGKNSSSMVPGAAAVFHCLPQTTLKIQPPAAVEVETPAEAVAATAAAETASPAASSDGPSDDTSDQVVGTTRMDVSVSSSPPETTAVDVILGGADPTATVEQHAEAGCLAAAASGDLATWSALVGPGRKSTSSGLAVEECSLRESVTPSSDAAADLGTASLVSEVGGGCSAFVAAAAVNTVADGSAALEAVQVVDVSIAHFVAATRELKAREAGADSTADGDASSSPPVDVHAGQADGLASMDTSPAGSPMAAGSEHHCSATKQTDAAVTDAVRAIVTSTAVLDVVGAVASSSLHTWGDEVVAPERSVEVMQSVEVEVPSQIQAPDVREQAAEDLMVLQPEELKEPPRPLQPVVQQQLSTRLQPETLPEAALATSMWADGSKVARVVGVGSASKGLGGLQSDVSGIVSNPANGCTGGVSNLESSDLAAAVANTVTAAVQNGMLSGDVIIASHELHGVATVVASAAGYLTCPDMVVSDAAAATAVGAAGAEPSGEPAVPDPCSGLEGRACMQAGHIPMATAAPLSAGELPSSADFEGADGMWTDLPPLLAAATEYTDPHSTTVAPTVAIVARSRPGHNRPCDSAHPVAASAAASIADGNAINAPLLYDTMGPLHGTSTSHQAVRSAPDPAAAANSLVACHVMETIVTPLDCAGDDGWGLYDSLAVHGQQDLYGGLAGDVGHSLGDAGDTAGFMDGFDLEDLVPGGLPPLPPQRPTPPSQRPLPMEHPTTPTDGAIAASAHAAAAAAAAAAAGTAVAVEDGKGCGDREGSVGEVGGEPKSDSEGIAAVAPSGGEGGDGEAPPLDADDSDADPDVGAELTLTGAAALALDGDVDVDVDGHEGVYGTNDSVMGTSAAAAAAITAACGGGGGGGRGRASAKASGAHIGPAPEDLAREPIITLRELHAEPEADMHLRDCQRAMDAMLQALQSHCSHQWLARLQLRDVMMETYRDFKVLDWVLKRVANVRIGGYVVYRSKYVVTRSYYYRLERQPDTPPDAPLSYTVPMPAHGPYARKGNRLIKPRTSGATNSAAVLAVDATGSAAVTDAGAAALPSFCITEAVPAAVEPSDCTSSGDMPSAAADPSAVTDHTALSRSEDVQVAGPATPTATADTGQGAVLITPTDEDFPSDGPLPPALAPAEAAAPLSASAPETAAKHGQGTKGIPPMGAVAAAVQGVPGAACNNPGLSQVQGEKAQVKNELEAQRPLGAPEEEAAGAEAAAPPSGDNSGSTPAVKVQVEEATASPEAQVRATVERRLSGVATGHSSASAPATSSGGGGSAKVAKAVGARGAKASSHAKGLAGKAAARGAQGPAPVKVCSKGSGVGDAAAAAAVTAAASGTQPNSPSASAATSGHLTGSASRPSIVSSSWRDKAKEHQSEGQALLDSVLESRIDLQQQQGPLGGGGGCGTGTTGGGRTARPTRVPRELRYLMSQSTLTKLKQQEQQSYAMVQHQQQRQKQEEEEKKMAAEAAKAEARGQDVSGSQTAPPVVKQEPLNAGQVVKMVGLEAGPMWMAECAMQQTVVEAVEEKEEAEVALTGPSIPSCNGQVRPLAPLSPLPLQASLSGVRGGGDNAPAVSLGGAHEVEVEASERQSEVELQWGDGPRTAAVVKAEVQETREDKSALTGREDGSPVLRSKVGGKTVSSKDEVGAKAPGPGSAATAPTAGGAAAAGIRFGGPSEDVHVEDCNPSSLRLTSTLLPPPQSSSSSYLLPSDVKVQHMRPAAEPRFNGAGTSNITAAHVATIAEENSTTLTALRILPSTTTSTLLLLPKPPEQQQQQQVVLGHRPQRTRLASKVALEAVKVEAQLRRRGVGKSGGNGDAMVAGVMTTRPLEAAPLPPPLLPPPPPPRGSAGGDESDPPAFPDCLAIPRKSRSVRTRQRLSAAALAAATACIVAALGVDVVVEPTKSVSATGVATAATGSVGSGEFGVSAEKLTGLRPVGTVSGDRASMLAATDDGAVVATKGSAAVVKQKASASWRVGTADGFGDGGSGSGMDGGSGKAASMPGAARTASTTSLCAEMKRKASAAPAPALAARTERATAKDEALLKQATNLASAAPLPLSQCGLSVATASSSSPPSGLNSSLRIRLGKIPRPAALKSPHSTDRPAPALPPTSVTAAAAAAVSAAAVAASKASVAAMAAAAGTKAVAAAGPLPGAPRLKRKRSLPDPHSGQSECTSQSHSQLSQSLSQRKSRERPMRSPHNGKRQKVTNSATTTTAGTTSHMAAASIAAGMATATVAGTGLAAGQQDTACSPVTAAAAAGYTAPAVAQRPGTRAIGKQTLPVEPSTGVSTTADGVADVQNSADQAATASMGSGGRTARMTKGLRGFRSSMLVLPYDGDKNIVTGDRCTIATEVAMASSTPASSTPMAPVGDFTTSQTFPVAEAAVTLQDAYEAAATAEEPSETVRPMLHAAELDANAGPLMTPYPAAADSLALVTAMGTMASQEPYLSLLRSLPLTYIHKAKLAAASAGPPPDPASAGTGGKRGRPGCLAAWVMSVGGGTGGNSGGSCTSFDPEPSPPTNPYVVPGKAHHNTSLTYINDQTQCDMQYLYCSILRVYKPALGVAAALISKHYALLRPLALPNMAAAVQLLKDTRYLVKDYGGGTAAAAAAATAADGKLRVFVALHLDEEPMAPQQQQALSRRGGAARAATAAASVAATAAHAPPPRVPRQLTMTPPEVVIVEPAVEAQAEATDTGVAPAITLGDLKRAAANALKETYRMCCPRNGAGIVVTTIVQGLDEQILAQGDSAVLGPPFNVFGAQSAPEPDAELPLPQPQVPMVVVRCSSLELDRRWRHAGGPEDWRVACLCGTQDDDGERMIACDVCGVWSHTRCNDIPDGAEEPPSFCCQECAKKRNPGTGTVPMTSLGRS